VTELFTIAALLVEGYRILSSLEQPRLEADLLLGHLLKLEREGLIIQRTQPVSIAVVEQFRDLCQRRLQGEPLAYILGYKEFWSLKLEVNRFTLIPRPETEMLVELALRWLPNAALNIVELGVGSGAVAIALARERPEWQITATDISLEAIRVAQKNANQHRVQNISFIQSDWYQALPLNHFDAIISKPPYIAANDPHLKDLAWEPSSALISGVDGLDAIRAIIKNAQYYLKSTGLLLLEQGFDQAETVQTLMRLAGLERIENHLDLSGNYRVTMGWKK